MCTDGQFTATVGVEILWLVRRGKSVGVGLNCDGLRRRITTLKMKAVGCS